MTFMTSASYEVEDNESNPKLNSPLFENRPNRIHTVNECSRKEKMKLFVHIILKVGCGVIL